MSRSWLQQSERGSPGALRLIRWIALRLGRSTARAFLYPITLYFILTARRSRRASAAFLSAALGRPARLGDVFRHMHTFAAVILDRVFFLSGQFHRFDIDLHHDSLVHDQVARGQGAILLGSHLGSFECLRTLAMNKAHIPVKVLMQRDHNQLITSLLEALNPSVAQAVIPLGRPDSLLRAKDWVDGGGLLGVLGDRVANSDKNVRCDFFGRPANFPAGPLLIAATFRVPVILFFGLYRGDNRYELHFELLTERVELARGNRDEDLRALTQRYAERLEYYARQAPYNWFNFYDYWDDQPLA